MICPECAHEVIGSNICPFCGANVEINVDLKELITDGSVSDLNFFTYKGRMNRKHYIIAYLLIVALGFFTIYTSNSIPGYYSETISIVITMLYLFASIKRMRDLMHSLWWLFLLIIPFVNIGFQVYLLFKKGCFQD